MRESTKKTLEYYNNNAIMFKNDTINVEFRDNQNMLLKYLNPGDTILDLGCGAGRDSKAFIEKGLKVVAIDGSEELCKIASAYIGQEVICKKFSELDYKERFDGVWACASLLHIEYNELQQIMKRVIDSMKVGSYLYVSFKYGYFEGYRNNRYFTDFTEDKFDNFVRKFVNIEIIEQKITSDARKGRENEKWLNVIIKKVA